MPLALYLLALAVFAMGTSEFMPAGLVPEIAADLGVGRRDRLPADLGLRGRDDHRRTRNGRPRTPVAGSRHAPRPRCLFALFHVVGAVTPTFAILFAARVVAALANAGFLAVALSIATGLVAEDRKGRALAVPPWERPHSPPGWDTSGRCG